MRKAITILSILVSLMLVLGTVSCAKDKAEATTVSTPNTKPSITGVADTSVEAGSEFNALQGVVASDNEDGDITSLVVIDSTPSLSFKNGKATPEKAGSYELVYSVTDKGGLTAEAYATLTVTRQTAEPVLYRDFDFSTQVVTDNHGWVPSISDAASATAAMKQGAYVFDIANPGNGDGDVQLKKAGVALKPADYKVKVWAKATEDTYCHLLARDEQADGWATFGGVYNAKITKEIAPIELNFTVDREGSTELLLNLGKITPNPDNPSDTTPENFSVIIDKIEFFEISGSETLVPVYTADFSSQSGVNVEFGDGASLEDVTYTSDSADIQIASYPTSGGVWSIKVNMTLGNVQIRNGEKYSYSFVITADSAAQSGECLVESASRYDSNRVNFNSFSAPAGEQTVVSGTFVADKDVDDPVIRLQVGNPSDGATSNTLHIQDVKFYRVEGDKETTKTIDSFIAFGNGTPNETNPEHPWTTFNGTDEDNALGVGTIWTEDGSLFYRIDQGGTTDWHNKLICGYGDNPLVLEDDSYYRLEITARATKPVSCGLFLNPLGGWDPRISEGLDLTTEYQTFSFTTTDTLIVDMNFEMLFQFGSSETAELGEVTVEFSDIKLYQMMVN